MARFARYLREEKYITTQDAGGIRKRWEYGRRLLTDGRATTPSGNLRNGVLDTLTGNATASGYPLSRGEIQRRMQCGRTYLTEAQLHHAVMQYGTWHDLVNAGFPEVEAGVDGEPYDPRDTDEKWRDFREAQERREAEDHRQGELFELPTHFSHDTYSPRTPISTLIAACDESERYTANMQKKDSERRAYVTELEAAAEGNLNMTWYEAEARRLGLGSLGIDTWDEFHDIIQDFFGRETGEQSAGEPDDDE